MTKINPTNFKRKPLAMLVALSLGLSGAQALAQEQEDSAENEQGIERIFVTAGKRLQGLQETPIAVTVTSGEAIEQTKVLDISDLQSLVPTLRVSQLQRSTNTNFSIRGFGNGSNNTGIEPSVGVFIDGVYRSRSGAQIGDLPRLQQIEVLSGPQSTLFGKNASAGVISVRTNAPSFAREAKVEAGIGNYNQRLLKGYFTDSVSDELAFSVSGGVNKRDGHTESVVGLDDLNNRDRWNIRGQALFEPTEDVSFRFIADYNEISERCCTAADIVDGPTTGVVQLLGGVVLDPADPFAYQSALTLDPVNDVEDGGVSLQLDVDYDNFALTSITAYRTNESSYISDVDFASIDLLQETQLLKIDTFTQELRLTSTGKNTLDWMLGAFYFSEEVDSRDTLFFGEDTYSFFDTLLVGAGLPPGFFGTIEATILELNPGDIFAADTEISTSYLQKNDAFSLFASFDYHVSDDLTATLGVSYTDDQKDVTVTQTNTDFYSAVDLNTAPTVFGIPFGSIPDFVPLLPTLASFQFVPPMLEVPNSIEDGSTSDSKVTYSFRLAYRLNDNVNFFATAATGFKASSWNLSRDTRPFTSDQTAIESAGIAQPNQGYGSRFAGPEESTVYELGMKARFQNGAFNIALFDQTIDGFQSSIFVGTGFVLANAGMQSTQGVEFDSSYNVTDNLVVTFAGTLLDPIYDSFVEAQNELGAADLSGTQPAGIHERSFTFGVTYNYEFDSGMYGYVRSDYLYESEARLVDNIPPEHTREVSSLNASAGMSLDNGVSFQIWVRNLTNDEYFMSAFPAPVQAGSLNAYPNQPRTYGASVSYEF